MLQRLFALLQKQNLLILEAIQKAVEFYHNKSFDLLRFGCTLANLATTFLHLFNNAKIYPIEERNRVFPAKGREDLDGGLSVVGLRRYVINNTDIRQSVDVCKTNKRTDASQLYA